MAKTVNPAFLTSTTDSGVEKPSRKIPIGWTIFGATLFSFAIWYQVIVIAVKVIRHFLAIG